MKQMEIKTEKINEYKPAQTEYALETELEDVPSSRRRRRL